MTAPEITFDAMCNNCESYDTDVDVRFTTTDYTSYDVTCTECGWTHTIIRTNRTERN